MKNNKKGFSLIEMMIVIAIIAVLTSIIFPMVTGSTVKAAAAANAANLRMVESQMTNTRLMEPMEVILPYYFGDKASEKIYLTTKNISAPNAQEMEFGGVVITEGTPVRCEVDTNTIRASYNGYGIDYFAAIAEGTDPGEITLGLDDLLFNAMGDAVEEAVELYNQIMENGDCTMCAANGNTCEQFTYYYTQGNSNLGNANYCTCGHAESAHHTVTTGNLSSEPESEADRQKSCPCTYFGGSLFASGSTLCNKAGCNHPKSEHTLKGAGPCAHIGK